MKNENQEAVAELYSLGLTFLKSQDWQNAIKCFKDVLVTDPEHEGATAGLQEAEKQLDLADSYEKGQRAFDDGMWEEAIEYFEKVVSLGRNYKDAMIKLEEAKKQKELLTLYEFGSQHYRKEEWSRAIELFEIVVSLDSRYRDAAAMLRVAKKKGILAVDIEYPNEMRSELAHRFPERGWAYFYIGSRLIVHERQAAVFFRDGHALDVFGPGQHTISTDNIPLLISSIGEDFNEEMLLSAEIYYVSMREFVGGWGTLNPILVSNPRSGIVLFRGNGLYSYSVSNLQRFVEQIGRQGMDYEFSQIQDCFREVLQAVLHQVLTELSKGSESGLEIISNHQKIATGVISRAQKEFSAIGITLKKFHITTLLPSWKAVDELRAMGILESSIDDLASEGKSEIPSSRSIYVDKGEIFMGDKKVEVKLGDKATFHGDFVLANSIKGSFNKAASADISKELRDMLKDLSVVVAKMVEALPKEEGKRVARALETLTEEAISEKPERQWWEVSVEGLTKAAKNIGEIGKPVLDIVARLVPILTLKSG